MSIYYYSLATAAVLGLVTYLWQARQRRSLSLPPGFNLLEASHKDKAPWEVYKEGSDTCESDIIHIKLQGKYFIVINSYSVAHELLEKRSGSYSSRPQLPMMDLMGRQNNVVVQQYGQRLRIARQLINSTFGARKSAEWMPAIQKECLEFLGRLYADSKPDFKRSIQRYVGTFITRLTYGKDLDEDYLRLVDQVSEHGSQAAIPGRWWVNSYPVLKYYPSWAPGGDFQRWAKHARDLFDEFTSKPFNSVKEQLQRSPDTVLHSFVQKNLVTVVAKDSSTEPVVAGTAASMYSAAVDTTTSILTMFFLIMSTHPQVQDKAAAEIREVVGRDRLPNLGDAGNLPYVEALIKELHRYHPVVPFLLRSAPKSDGYEGYLIPQNAWILINTWGITHNQEEYERPDEFDPERYTQGTLRDPRDFTFGIGRRRCPGMAIGNAAIYLAITGILATYSIEPVREEGTNSMPRIEFTQSVISSPLTFPCLIQPRHHGVKSLIEQALDQVGDSGFEAW